MAPTSIHGLRAAISRIELLLSLLMMIQEFSMNLIKSNPHFKCMENSCIIIIYLHIYGLTIDPRKDLLPVGLVAQLVEHCTGIAGVRVQIPVQAFETFVTAPSSATMTKITSFLLKPF